MSCRCNIYGLGSLVAPGVPVTCILPWVSVPAPGRCRYFVTVPGGWWGHGCVAVPDGGLGTPEAGRSAPVAARTSIGYIKGI